jgi:hypothetical protein
MPRKPTPCGVTVPLDGPLGHSWDSGHLARIAETRPSPQITALTCNNNGGRGRYRTADRWCVKPELYH